MGDIIRRVWRLILATISFGLIKYETPTLVGPYVVENMKKKLADLKASAVPVIANQYRLERMLDIEQKKLTQIDADARQAVLKGEDELASNLLMQKETSEARVEELKAQLEAAGRHAAEAKQQIELFQEELQEATDRARNAQLRYQLATMAAQVQKFYLSPSLDEDKRAIERMEERADEVLAEANARSEVAALNDEIKQSKMRHATRKIRAEQALADLKAEMGIADMGKPSTEPPARQAETPSSDQEQVEDQSQQGIIGTGSSGD